MGKHDGAVWVVNGLGGRTTNGFDKIRGGEGARYRLIAREIRLNHRCSTSHRAWSSRRRRREVNLKGPTGDGEEMTAAAYYILSRVSERTCTDGGDRFLGERGGGGIKRILAIRSADGGGVCCWKAEIEERGCNRP